MWEVRTDKTVYASFEDGLEAVQFMVDRGLTYNQAFYLKENLAPITLIHVTDKMKKVIKNSNC